MAQFVGNGGHIIEASGEVGQNPALPEPWKAYAVGSADLSVPGSRIDPLLPETALSEAPVFGAEGGEVADDEITASLPAPVFS